MKAKHFLKLSISVLLIISFSKIYSQDKINLDDIKLDRSVYIFYGTPDVIKTDDKGNPLTTDDFLNSTAPNNSTFTIHKKMDDDTYIIRFRSWSTRKGLFEDDANFNKKLTKALKYNYVVPAGTFATFQKKIKPSERLDVVTTLAEEAFFTVSTQDLKEYAYIYNPKPRYEFNYGTISYLARMRPKIGLISGKWSTDLNLGLTAGLRRNFGNNIGLSILAGLAITKINLDSVSTNGTIKSTSEKPAFTPSLNMLFSYQNFSVGFGIGMDWINEDSKETSAWIYNKKIFYAVGFGINIFRTSSNEKTTASQDQ
jgi:hypothetical protein